MDSKYTSYGKNRKEGPYPGIGVNHCGNSKKNLRVSVEEALKRLRTNYIDVLYVHWWVIVSAGICASGAELPGGTTRPASPS